jgi:hypothetical protein
MTKKNTVGIYFKTKYSDPAAIIQKTSELAQTFSLGTATDDLLAALASGTATL